VGRKTVRGSRR